MAKQGDLFPDSDPTPMDHHCHAQGCPKRTQPKMLMCYPHWKMVPIELQRRVWAEYRAGQEVRKDPTGTYLDAADAAIAAVAKLEGRA